MEIGDIIYIVLVAIFVLGGLLKRKKKNVRQQAETQVEAEPVFSGQSMQDFDDWLMGKETVVQPQSIPVTPEKKVVRNQNANVFSSSRVKQKVAPRTKPQSISDLIIHSNDNAGVNLNIELNTVEDARKAFIYSEIFQRKY